MKSNFESGTITSQKWELENVSINHNIVDYNSYDKRSSSNALDVVRLHFGLSGDYNFNYKQLGKTFSLKGHHNNIMYSDGLEIEVHNRSKRIETFGINFSKESFVAIAQNGNDPLKRLAEKVMSGEHAILSSQWQPNTVKIQMIIQEILNCPFTDGLKDLFLYSKTIELLVLQASLYESAIPSKARSNKYKDRLIHARAILDQQLSAPPTLSELSKAIALNEYALKKEFKALFGTTVFGYVHKQRMLLAKQLLLGTAKSSKEIAYELGYSSPQHFSKAFRKEFATSPNRIRNTPDITL